MSKIIVEDYTKPPDKEAMINGLANMLSIYAASIGTKAGLTHKDIILAVIQTGEEMAQYLFSLDKITKEEVGELYKQAVDNATKRVEILKKTGVTDMAKKMLDRYGDGNHE